MIPTVEFVARSPEDARTIRSSTLFGRLSEAAFHELFDGQPVMVAGKGATVFAWGAPADTCFILLQGLVKLFRTSEAGETAVMAIHGPGRALMLAEALIGKPCSASAEVVSPARLLCLDAGTLRRRMDASSGLSMALLAAAAADLRQLVVHVEELKAMTGPARLATMILDLSEARSGAREISLPYEKQLIAGRLGMTPESFSRAMAQLGEHGVRVSRNKLVIGDIARLRAFARRNGA